jgi:tetratricopeptide (TPR) repeat protein
MARSLSVLLAAATLAAFMAACAAKAPVVTPGAARFPDYPFPAVPAGLQAGPSTIRDHELAWALLQSGDARRAGQRFAAVVKRQPGFFPSRTGAGFADLARRDFRAALGAFEAALQAAPGYGPALVGRGDALLGLGREAEGLASLEAAVAADPGLSDVRQRVEALRFRGVQEAIAAAQGAAAAGRWDEARARYLDAVAASPDSAFLYRELASVERRAGRPADALAHGRDAAARDPSDASAQVLLGEILEEQSQWDEAVRAYEAAYRLDPTPETAERVARVKQRSDAARLPSEYRAIPRAARVTRGDLAALIGVRLDQFTRASARPAPVLVNDVRSHWAQPWIMAVVRAGFMEVYGNHTFQPRAVVRRSDLAQAVSRVLATVTSGDPARAAAWHQARVRFSDIGPGHLHYGAASTAVAAGVMSAGDGDAFQPSRPVTGAEAVEAVTRLEAIVGGGAGPEGPASRTPVGRGFSPGETGQP